VQGFGTLNFLLQGSIMLIFMQVISWELGSMGVVILELQLVF